MVLLHTLSLSLCTTSALSLSSLQHESTIREKGIKAGKTRHERPEDAFQAMGKGMAIWGKFIVRTLFTQPLLFLSKYIKFFSFVHIPRTFAWDIQYYLTHHKHPLVSYVYFGSLFQICNLKLYVAMVVGCQATEPLNVANSPDIRYTFIWLFHSVHFLSHHTTSLSLSRTLSTT